LGRSGNRTPSTYSSSTEFAAVMTRFGTALTVTPSIVAATIAIRTGDIFLADDNSDTVHKFSRSTSMDADTELL
jgi:hypothetical protein